MTSTTPSSKKFAATKLTEVPNLMDKRELVGEVLASLDDWKNWIDETNRGILKICQFLALILWCVQTDKSTEMDRELIVWDWWCELKKHLRIGSNFALNPVALLPLKSRVGAHELVIPISFANEFLKTVPVGFDCYLVIDQWKKEAASLNLSDADELPPDELIRQRKADKSSPWTAQQRAAATKMIEVYGYAPTAKKIGIAVQTLRKNMQRAKNHVPDKRYAQLMGVKASAG